MKPTLLIPLLLSTLTAAAPSTPLSGFTSRQCQQTHGKTICEPPIIPPALHDRTTEPRSVQHSERTRMDGTMWVHLCQQNPEFCAGYIHERDRVKDEKVAQEWEDRLLELLREFECQRTGKCSGVGGVKPSNGTVSAQPSLKPITTLSVKPSATAPAKPSMQPPTM